MGFIDPRIVGVGDAAAGLCGGMSWYVRRQVLSLDWLRGPWRFWRAASMRPDALARRTLEVEWPPIRAAIDAGRLPLVGLIRHHGWNPFDLARDHTLVAFGYTVDPASSTITLRVYDPNWPDRDDVTLAVGSTGMRQSTGEPLLGLIQLPGGAETGDA